ncbi:MAG TPA: N-6 DNA methylase [Thermomicrobiaceae bacterium]|nr:N-6 DNA methylase [Thermomicrobiaceae bacterium]
MENGAKTGAPSQLDINTLEHWLWDAACAIRGPIDAPKFKDYILPLVFLKRVSDVFDDELDRLTEEFGDREFAEQMVQDDHSLVRIFVPAEARWSTIRQQTTGLGELLTDAVRALARENSDFHGVVDVVDFNATTAGQRIIDEPYLTSLIRVLSQHRIGLDDVEADLLGQAYEYLLRKFAEGQGQSAGEFYTPPNVGIMMARILDPQPGMTVYDPACGSSGLLIRLNTRFLETHGVDENGHRKLPSSVDRLRLFGQEINPTTFAMARMNAAIHQMQAEIAIGDTMRHPVFTEAAGALQRFDIVTANPMWNQKFPGEVYEHDPYDRFIFGNPPTSSADWGWLQHMLASLDQTGRMAVVLDTGAVSRGSGNAGSNRERDIRKGFVDGSLLAAGDLIESVILLPENLFYNTTAPGIVIIVNRAKRHPGEILLINTSKLFEKERPKNVLPMSTVEQIAEVYHQWRAEEGLSAIINTADAVKNDYNLSPSRYVSTGEQEDVLPLEEAVVLLAEAEEERSEADRKLGEVLAALGLDGWHGSRSADDAGADGGIEPERQTTLRSDQ